MEDNTESIHFHTKGMTSETKKHLWEKTHTHSHTHMWGNNYYRGLDLCVKSLSVFFSLRMEEQHSAR